LKISIITVSFNSSITITDTINSVFNQSYKNIEYIIVDGKSTDRTIEIIKEYENKFEEKGIEYKWISEPDKGIYDAINKGIKMATGEVVGILNSDDYFYDHNVVNDVAQKFKKDSPDCIYGNIIYVNSKENNKITRRWKSREFEDGLFEKSWTPGHPTFYCRRELYGKFGLYRTDFKIAADVELMYRFIVKHSVRSQYFDRYMVTMRQGGVSNNGLQSTITITKEMKIALQENGGKFNIFKYLFYKGLKVKEFLLA
jgi:glycosyltransferase involved in cell wall biosynthesis